MPIGPSGSLNLSAVNVPNVYVQIIPPNPIINGVPTNIIGVVGLASWGPVNSPVTIGSMTEYLQNFGNPLPQLYDMGTQVYNASQQGANSFVCVRVTDGSDEVATADILDGSSVTGAILDSIYTGTLGNTTVAILSLGSSYTPSSPTYKVTIYINNGIPEVFDNLGGTGITFWTNFVNAINKGQNGFRGPSEICTATIVSTLSSITITAGGSYAGIPTFAIIGPGSGAVLTPSMKALTATPVTQGTGYVQGNTITLTGGTHSVTTILTVQTTSLTECALNSGGTGYAANDLITVAGGTSSSPAIIKVLSVNGSGVIQVIEITDGGSYTVNSSSFTQASTTGSGTGFTANTALFGVLTATVTTAGAYTVLPANPVAQGSTSGSGVSANFNMTWAVVSCAVTTAGSGYQADSVLSISGGSGSGAAGSLVITGASTPALDTYILSDGTNGNNNVSDATLIGNSAATPRTGMWALQNTLSSIVVLADQTNPTYWTNQITFAEEESMYMMGTVASGYENNIAGAISLKQTQGISSYLFELMMGDWCYINDPFNNVQRLTSPQGFIAGKLATLATNNSSLNKPLNGIVATEKSANQQFYSDADLLQIETGGLNVITIPNPGGYYFASRLGINTSGNIVTNNDAYTRTINFLGLTLEAAIGPFIGQPYTPTVVNQVQASIQAFLLNLYNQNLIGNVNSPNSPKDSFSVTMDTSLSSQGILIANVKVVFYSIVQLLVVNLQGGSSVTINVLPPQLLAA